MDSDSKGRRGMNLFTPILKLLLLVGFVAYIGMPFAAAQSNQPLYTLGAGDKLRVTVFGEKDLSGEFDIDGAGNVSLPLIGEVQAGNQSPRQLEEAIANRLKDGVLKEPKVTVDVLNYRPFYILGEVRQPGSYAYVNGISILKAVAMAGGFTYRADKRDIRVIRGAEAARLPRNSDDRGERVGQHTVVLPGDVITVTERFF
jgi:protein involved in polysaccharide export with SLBB domain